MHARAGDPERVPVFTYLLPSSSPCNCAAAVARLQGCSCLRCVTGVSAAVTVALCPASSQVIFDDGNIPNLSALSNIRSVNGPLVVYGNANASLQTLAGLEGIRVRGAGERRGSSQPHGWLCACHMHSWPAWAKQHACLQKP